MGRFLVLFAAYFCLFLAAVGILNYLTDPSGLFRDSSGGPEIQLAKILAEKSHALVGSNFDERIFQMLRLRQEKQIPSVVITGSSRMMPVGSETLGVPVLNLSVSAASLEDHLALALEASKKPGPEVFLLGIDPWIFNENLGPTAWRSLRNEYAEAARVVGITGGPGPGKWDSRFLQLINYDYTVASLNLILHPAKNARAVSATMAESPEENRMLIRYDGSRVNSQRATATHLEEINRQAREYANPPVYNLANFKLSDRLMADFFKFVDYLRKDFRVIFVLPPYHPIAYPLINKEYPDISKIEHRLRDEASKRGISVIGSYDPKTVGCVDSDFSDGMHPTASCWEKIFLCPEWREIAGGLKTTHDSMKTNNHVQ